MTDFSKKALLQRSAAFINQGYYSKAFKVFEHLSAQDFIEFTTSEIVEKETKTKLQGPFKNKLANRAFWKDIALSNKERLGKLLETDYSFDLFTYYFKSDENINIELLEFLSEKFPVKLIQFIRVNKAFLREAHFTSLAFLENHRNAYLSLHFQCFVQLRNIIAGFKADESRLSDGLKGCDFWDGFIRIVLYLEKHSFEQNDYSFLQSAGGAFLSVIKWYKKLNDSIPEIYNVEKFEELQLKHFNEAKAKGDDYFKHPFIDTMNFIHQYHNFRSHLLLHYCYNLNVEPRETKAGVVELDYINYDEEYNWKINGLMYEKIGAHYLDIGTNFVEELIREGKYPFRGKSDIDKERNILLSCERYACLFMLDDLNIKTIPTEEGNIDIERPLFFIYPFVVWGKSRRLIAKNTGSKTWVEHISNVTALNLLKRVPVFPIRMDEKITFFQMAKASGNPNDSYEEIVPLFTTEICNDYSKFSPYDPLEDLFYKPILEINSKYYTLTLMLEGCNPFMTVYGAFTDSYERARMNVIKKENDELERMIAKLLKEMEVDGIGNSIEYFSNDETNRRLGDIDLCFMLNGELLLIELKRTKYRLDAEQRWIEKQRIINKAADQLNRAEKYLRDNPFFLSKKGVLEISTNTIPIRKYICTSSPEYRATVANGCEVISMQEFLHVLKYEMPSNKKFTKARLLQDYFRSGGFQMQLTPEEMEIHRTPIFFSNEEIGRNYNEKYNSAAEAYRHNKLDQAIRLWQECLSVDDQDASTWGALGNCFADQKNYATALEHFNHALNLTPNDYLILANRAITYLEMGRSVDYFTEMANVMRIYKTGSQVMRNTFAFLISQNRLKENEIVEIGKLIGL